MGKALKGRKTDNRDEYMKEQYEVKRLDRPVDWTVDVPDLRA